MSQAIGEPAREVGIFTTDTDLVVRSWDAPLAALTGIASDLAVGRPIPDLVPDLHARGMLDLLREPLVSGCPVVLAPALHKYLIPCPPRRPSEEFAHMQQRVVIGALRDDEHAAGIVVTVEDVTERLERERQLTRQLRDANPAERLEAVRRLGTDDADLRHLSGVIADDDWRVRRAAVKSLARTRDAALVEAIVGALREGHRDFSLLSSALQLLTLTGVDLTAALVGLLGDPDADLRMQAALALGTQRGPEAAAALLGALDDEDPNVQFHAIEALGKLASPAAIDRLAAIVESREFFLAFPAIEALVRIDDPSAAPKLVPLIGDPLLGAAAAGALGRLGDEGAIEPLVDALADASAPVVPIVSAIVAIHRRYERVLGSGAEIEDLFARRRSASAVTHVLAATARANGDALRDLVHIVSWLRDAEAPALLARLLGSDEVKREVIEALVRFGAPAGAIVIDQLSAGDTETRRAAAVALGRMGDRRAVGPLVCALDDDDGDVRLAAIGSLARLGDAAAFEPLMALIGEADAGIRQAAIGALNSIGHPAMQESIRPLLESPDARTRESAVKIAGYFGYPACLTPFLARCQDADDGVRASALELLPYFDAAETVDVLANALARGSARVRAAAAKALGAVRGEQATALLRQAIADADPWVRYFAAMSIGKSRDAATTADLMRLATADPAQQVRVAALDAVGALGGPSNAPALLRLASDEDTDVAHAALRVLGRLGLPEGTGALVEALRSTSERTRLVAVEALSAGTTSDAVEALRWTAAADASEAVASAALDGLVSIASSGASANRLAASALFGLAGDGARGEGAVAALSRLAPSAIPWLAEALSTESSRVRVAIIAALARMLHPAATASLQGALDNDDPDVRRRAVVALSRIGTRGLADRLAALSARDPSPRVRDAAAQALGRAHARGGRGGGA